MILSRKDKIMVLEQEYHEILIYRYAEVHSFLQKFPSCNCDDVDSWIIDAQLLFESYPPNGLERIKEMKGTLSGYSCVNRYSVDFNNTSLSSIMCGGMEAWEGDLKYLKQVLNESHTNYILNGKKVGRGVSEKGNERKIFNYYFPGLILILALIVFQLKQHFLT